jgi:hypothetical protein
MPLPPSAKPYKVARKRVLSLAAGYDSNFNSATDAQKIALFDGLFYATLSPAQRRQDSPFMQLRAISSHSRPLSRLSSWDVLAYFNHRWVSEDNDYSLSGAGAQIGSRHLFGAWQLRPSLNLTQYLLGGEEYQQDLSLSGDVFWQISPQFQPFARLNLLRLDNKINNDTDKLRPQIESGSSFNFGALNGQISVNYGQDFKAHRSAIYMRDGLGASLQAQYRWGFGDIYTQLLWQSSQYQEKMALFSKREDNFGLLLLGYRQHLNSQFSLYAQVSQSENDSTVKLYQYSRTLAETGLTWAF